MVRPLIGHHSKAARIEARTPCAVLLFSLALSCISADQIETGDFRLQYDDRGITGLANPHDPFSAQILAQGQRLSLLLRSRVGAGDWSEMAPAHIAQAQDNEVTYTNLAADGGLAVTQTFQTDGKAMDWFIKLEARTNFPIEIGDLAISVPAAGPRGEEPKAIFERGFLKHQFISGNGSFLYFVRASGIPPFLVLTVLPGTKLEYFTAGAGGRGSAQVFIHSGLTGGREQRGTWRQPHTFLTLAADRDKNETPSIQARGGDGPRSDQVSSPSPPLEGRAGEGRPLALNNPGSSAQIALPARARYGFRFRWANSYTEMRQILYDEGLFDIRVVPGMTIPTDLTARFALHTKSRIDSISAEFPKQTRITAQPQSSPGYHLYEVSFQHLGENKLTIHHDAGRTTFLEFFVTEPLETLIKKRSAFIIARQQIHDPSKWWDGVFAPWDMRHKVLRTIDDPDIFTNRMIYVLTCDDPGLCKAPFVAEKNVSFPNAREIEGLEYYLEHFVWGHLQRTDKEQPYPYGVYGTPNWYTDRNPERRKAAAGSNSTALRDLSKEHVWRSYDYPHMVMFYFHMYQIAKLYPKMSKYLDAAGYLDRAYQTARAFFTYPYEIYPTYYETYKWGLYNELVVLKLADALEREGLPDRAAWLRSEWEKKVKYFVYDDPYPFRSEYAFDRTAFESSYALAKYGATRQMLPDTNLWYDVKLKKWYSHPLVKPEDSRAFMERQLAAGLSVRGWLEASYYQLGADPGLSYMAAMGGWGILDYAVNFASNPYDWLQLGYASYLSSWCLVNSGPAASNYGFWFPGKENDGAAGWQFMSAQHGRAWMGADVPRGPWHYDGEIDLGFGGALRMAATVVTHDPIFGWLAYGGKLTVGRNTLSVIPRDGLRQRFYAILSDSTGKVHRLKLELDRDGFAPEQPIVLEKSLKTVAFALENRTGDEHQAILRICAPSGTHYSAVRNGKKLPSVETGNWDYPVRTEVKISKGESRIELIAGPDRP